MAAFSAIMRGMNILSLLQSQQAFSPVSGDGWLFPGLTKLGGLPGLYGLLCLPAGGLKGLAISAATLLSGVVWAWSLFTVVHWHHIWKFSVMSYRYCRVSDVYSGQTAAAFICPGTFIGACATFAGQGDWKLVYLRWRLGWYLVTQ